jgi:hypothetical protein
MVFSDFFTSVQKNTHPSAQMNQDDGTTGNKICDELSPPQLTINVIISASIPNAELFPGFIA